MSPTVRAKYPSSQSSPPHRRLLIRGNSWEIDRALRLLQQVTTWTIEYRGGKEQKYGGQDSPPFPQVVMSYCSAISVNSSRTRCWISPCKTSRKNTSLPKKRSRKAPLTRADRKQNRAQSKRRVRIENVNAALKRFHILADKYRNRRKRFGLRFSLIAALYNKDLPK